LDSPNSVDVNKPLPILQRPVSFDLKSIFASILKATAHTATGKLDELPVDAAEFVGGLGLSEGTGALAYRLIQNALFKACLELTKERLSQLDAVALVGDHELNEKLTSSIDSLNINLDIDFFRDPKSSIFMADVVRVYTDWLILCRISSNEASSVANRLPGYFVFALATEWSENVEKYQTILDGINTPFSRAGEREHNWFTYFASLEKRISENIFEEAFSLSQVYVPLRAYFSEKQNDPSSDAASTTSKVVVDLESELISWLKATKRSTSIRVVCGGPGSGKSSFAKMFCVRVASQSAAKPVYIPLHLIDPTRDIVDEVGRCIRDEGILSFNPLSDDDKVLEQNILLIFDGLDELASQGAVAAQVARNFIVAVDRLVTRRNLGRAPISVLLCGREIVVQANETEFRDPRQILTVLPYFMPDKERDQYIDKESLLEDDQRDTWWQRYGSATGARYSGLPTNLKKHKVDEITSQPLLNYLVALSYARGKLNFDEKINLNNVYSDLVAAVYQRGYEQKGILKAISHISESEFQRILQEIGLAAWHSSDGRSTSVIEIERHCKESGLESLLLSFQEGAKAGVTKLLAAFFFRKNGIKSTGDETFVFTHKSFGEYLAATRIVRGMERITKELRRRVENADEGWDLVSGLVEWVKLVGPAQMTPYIAKFIRQEISLKTHDILAGWHEQLQAMFEVALRNNLPMDKVGSMSFAEAHRQRNNALETLLIALNACAVEIKRVSIIKWPLATSFGTFLKQISPQRTGAESPTVYSALSYMNLSKQRLDMLDLYNSDLHCSDLSYAKIYYANIASSNLSHVDLRGAILVDANLANSRLTSCNLEHATLHRTILRRADLNNANLQHARLVKADLERAILKNANISEASFSGANVRNIRGDAGVDWGGLSSEQDEQHTK
jgi:uncharacterized protein YjbI with pentapeptide repeats